MAEYKKSIRRTNLMVFKKNPGLIFCFLLIHLLMVLFIFDLPLDSGYSKTYKVSTGHNRTPFNLREALAPLNSHLVIEENFNSKDFGSTLNLFTLHQTLLKLFVDDYIRFHSLNRWKNAVRVLVFRPVRTGLGDRFERLMMAYYAAVVSKRIFLIDWQNPSPIEHLLGTNVKTTDFFFRKGIDDMFLQNGTKKFHKQFVLDDKEHIPKKFVNLLLSNEPFLVSSVTYRAERSTLESLAQERFGALNSIRYSSFLGSYICKRSMMHHVLRTRPEFVDDFKIQANKIGLGTYSGNSNKTRAAFTLMKYVSVHARIGTGVGETEQKFISRFNNLDMFAHCLSSRAVKTALHLTPEHGRLFLATDTPSFRARFEKSVSLLSQNKVQVVHGSWEPVHSNHLDPGRRHSGRAKKYVNYRGNGMWPVYMDILLLGNANHIIALKSSFSRFAFAIGTAKSFTDLTANNCLHDFKQKQYFHNPF